MLAITHLVVSLLLIQVLMLDRNDSFVALTFGVFIAMGNFLPSFLTATHGLTQTDAGARTAGFVVMATLARPLGAGQALDRHALP